MRFSCCRYVFIYWLISLLFSLIRISLYFPYSFPAFVLSFCIDLLSSSFLSLLLSLFPSFVRSSFICLLCLYVFRYFVIYVCIRSLCISLFVYVLMVLFRYVFMYDVRYVFKL